MAGKANPIPAGFHTITPHLIVRGGKDAVAFYQKAFGAEVKGVMAGPDGKVMHAELRIGDSALMLADEFLEMGTKSPAAIGGSPVTINVYTTDADALFNRAVAAGARVTMPLANMFWGDRYGKLDDPFGHHWAISTHLEDLTEQEIWKRAAEAMKDMPKKG